ncbi:autoinducer binding domain-containing protein [Erwinia sp. OPT-41]|uniref:Autoinducer binding domain-containing protein n=1 Tax=Erwinia plantamica TaxID=3237104 RepID=A0ABW7CL63_9GAMM
MLNLFKHQNDFDIEMRNCIQQQLTMFDDVIFTYALINKNNPNLFYILSNRIDWFESDYQINNRHRTDPVIITGTSGKSDFYWDQTAMSLSLGDVNIFKSARDYGVMQGHTFTLHDELNNVAMLTLIRKTGEIYEFRQTIERNQNNFKKILRDCHEKNMRMRGVECDVIYPGCRRYQIYQTADAKIVRPIMDNEIIAPIDTLAEIVRKRASNSPSGFDNIAS